MIQLHKFPESFRVTTRAIASYHLRPKQPADLGFEPLIFWDDINLIIVGQGYKHLVCFSDYRVYSVIAKLYAGLVEMEWQDELANNQSVLYTNRSKAFQDFVSLIVFCIITAKNAHNLVTLSVNFPLLNHT